MKKRIAVIPAYEPDRRMIDLVKEAAAEGFSLLLVDDGSGPEYRPLFEEAKAYAEVISYSKNRGKGHALKRAFAWLLSHEMGEYSVILLDSDGQHTVKDALRLFERLDEEPDALWLGTRYLPKDAPLRQRYQPLALSEDGENTGLRCADRHARLFLASPPRHGPD